MERKKNLIEFFCVSRGVEDGHEEWFRSVASAAAAVGVSSDRMERLCRSGKALELWSDAHLTFRIVPAVYKVVARATGQELLCRWDNERNVFVTLGGGVFFKKSQVTSYDEVKDGDIQG